MASKTKKARHDPEHPPINPSDFFVAAIRLTQEQGGADYHRMLGGARRCLDEFTLPLPHTDFKLLLRTDKSEFLECIEERFLGTYRRDNVLILPAFPSHNYSNALYWDTYLDALSDVRDALEVCANKLTSTKRVSSRTLTDPLYSTERFIHYFTHPQMPAYQEFLLKVQQGKKTPKFRAGAARLLLLMVDSLRSEYNTLTRQLQEQA